MTILENDNGAQMIKLIYPYNSCEPVIRETEGLNTPALVRDLKILVVGLWETGKNGFLDYRIIVNPGTPSYAPQDWKTILN